MIFLGDDFSSVCFEVPMYLFWRTKLLKRILFVTVLAYSFSAKAANFSCTGQVLSIGISPAGGVLQVNTGNGVHYLCKFQDTMNGVHPDVCKVWYSMFLSAQASGRAVTQIYDGASGGSCTTLGNWSVPNPMPYYVEVAK